MRVRVCAVRFDDGRAGFFQLVAGLLQRLLAGLLTGFAHRFLDGLAGFLDRAAQLVAVHALGQADGDGRQLLQLFIAEGAAGRAAGALGGMARFDAQALVIDGDLVVDRLFAGDGRLVVRALGGQLGHLGQLDRQFLLTGAELEIERRQLLQDVGANDQGHGEQGEALPADADQPAGVDMETADRQRREMLPALVGGRVGGEGGAHGNSALSMPCTVRMPKVRQGEGAMHRAARGPRCTICRQSGAPKTKPAGWRAFVRELCHAAGRGARRAAPRATRVPSGDRPRTRGRGAHCLTASTWMTRRTSLGKPQARP